MTDLKKQLIKLGSLNPELRPHIRTVLAEVEKRSAVSQHRHIGVYKKLGAIEIFTLVLFRGGVSVDDLVKDLKRETKRVEEDMKSVSRFLDGEGYVTSQLEPKVVPHARGCLIRSYVATLENTEEAFWNMLKSDNNPLRGQNRTFEKPENFR